MRLRIHQTIVALTAVLMASAGHAGIISASIGLTPGDQTVPLSAGTASMTLVMDFNGTSSGGGGLMLDLSGPISFGSFTPSDFFNGLNTDPGGDGDFTGYGTTNKPDSAEYEIHFGSFGGVTGLHDLGLLTFNLSDTGTGVVDLSINPSYAGFADFSPATTLELTDATIQVVPLPATAWLLATGFALAGLRLRRRS